MTQLALVHNADDVRVCKVCEQEKPVSDFSHQSRKKKVFSSNCRSCRSNKLKKTFENKMEERKRNYVPPVSKPCSRCKIEKPLSEFAKANWTMIGVTPDCKKCRNDRYKDPRGGSLKDRPDRLKRLYGISYEQVIRMHDLQHGMCANRACGSKISLEIKGTSRGRAVIDHDHATGKVRGLLCSPCNVILGTVETKKNLMLGLSEYLTRTPNNLTETGV